MGEMVLEELAAAHARWADHPASTLREVRLCLFEKENDVAADVGIALQRFLDSDGKASTIKWASKSISARLAEERCLLTQFLHEVSQDTGKYCFGIRQTVQAMHMGVIDTLIYSEELRIHRLILKDPTTRRQQTLYITPEQQRAKTLLRDPETGVELDVVEDTAFECWARDTCKQLGAKFECISDRSREGQQFCKGFSGIGALLVHPAEFDCSDESDAHTVDSDDDFA